MKYRMHIEGMMCQRCVAHVTNALTSVAGVTDVTVSLEDNSAVVTATQDVSAAIKTAVEEQDYTVKEIETL